MKRIAMVGSNGRIAQRHRKAIESIPGLLLVATVDSVGEATYQDYHKLLGRDDIDLVVIATPNGTHFQIAKEFLEWELEVLIEKPVAMTVQELWDLYVYPKAYAVLQLRYDEAVKRALEIPAEDIYSINLTIHWKRDQQYFQGWKGTKALDGGILLNQGIHYLDIIQLLATKGKGTQVRGFGYANTRAHEIETDDQFVGCLKFDNGILVSLDISLNCEGSQQCSLTVLHKGGKEEIAFNRWSYIPMYQAILCDQGLSVKQAMASLKLVELFTSRKESKIWINQYT